MYTAVTLLGWTVTFLGSTKTTAGNSVWNYFVEQDPDHPPERGLSHLSLALCPDPEHQVIPGTVLVNGEPWPDYVVEAGPQPIPELVDVYLIKFDELNLDTQDDPIAISFTLEGIWQPQPMLIGIKAGTFTEVGYVLGPSCQKPLNCDCRVDLEPLPHCENARGAILCAVAHEQAEMARMLRVLRCKLCKTVRWLPEQMAPLESSLEASMRMETDIGELIRAMARKEQAIAKKITSLYTCRVG